MTIPIRRCIALLAAAGAAAAVALTSVGPANAQTTLPGKLLPGQATSDVLDSPTGDFELNVQLSTVTEFQIVNYQHPGSSELVNTWEAIVPSGAGGTYRLIMQLDGNLVYYSPAGHPLWASRTSGHGNYFAVQDDGNLVVYSGTGHPLWASGSGPAALASGQTLHVGQTLRLWNRPGGSLSRLIMQADGNLVLYYGGRAVWASRTSGAGNRLTMQADGNLVLYSAAGKALWNTRTAVGKPAFLEVYAPPALIVSELNGPTLWRWN